MARVYLGLGSNIDPEDNLRLGIQELRRCFGGLSLSSIYESKAVGFEGADFLNMVVGFRTSDTPRQLQDRIESIHDLSGRNRLSDRFSSRPLDIDLLLYDDLVLETQGLRLPRCDVLQFSFVLRPLAELDPDLVHPVTGKTMSEHWQEFDAASHPLRRVDIIL